MKRSALIISAVVVVTVATASLIWGRTASARKPVVAAKQADWLIAGPGRVEPHSEDVKLAAELSGKLKAVLVEEGDFIQRGEVLAELENSDYRAQVESAVAEVKQRKAELRKVVNGARREERREAFSSVEEAKAVMNNAYSEMVRRQKLFDTGTISREEEDRYEKEYDVAKARYDAKVQSHALVDEDAREEDVAMAQANLENAKARLDAARALLAKTYVSSPIDGVVLRKHHRTGESVSNGATNPDPIFTIGDKQALRVRMDVDETDVAKLATGQRAYVTADAYGHQRFWGHVVRIGQELGRKNVRTDEPTEHVDTKILETLIELDAGTSLPVGLRVDAYIVGTK